MGEEEFNAQPPKRAPYIDSRSVCGLGGDHYHVGDCFGCVDHAATGTARPGAHRDAGAALIVLC